MTVYTIYYIVLRTIRYSITIQFSLQLNYKDKEKNMKNLKTIKEAEVKKMMKRFICRGEKFIDVDIAENVIWVVTKTKNGVYCNYTIMKESGRGYKNLPDMLHGEGYHYCDIVD